MNRVKRTDVSARAPARSFRLDIRNQDGVLESLVLPFVLPFRLAVVSFDSFGSFFPFDFMCPVFPVVCCTRLRLTTTVIVSRTERTTELTFWDLTITVGFCTMDFAFFGRG